MAQESPRFPGDMDVMDRDQLKVVIDCCAEGGTWFCGVTGDRTLAKALRVEPEDLETVSALAWNLIAKNICTAREDEQGAAVYEKIVAILYAQLPDSLQRSFKSVAGRETGPKQRGSKMALNDPRTIPYEFRVFRCDGWIWLYDNSSRSYPCTATPHIYAEALYTDDGRDEPSPDGSLFTAAQVDGFEQAAIDILHVEDIAPDVPESAAWDTASEAACAQSAL